MASNKHKAVWEWLQSCPLIQDLFFNIIQPKSGGTALVPSESVVEEYDDGSQLRWYNASLTRFQAFSSDPNDMANIEAVTDLEELEEWVAEQVRIGNLPQFPTGCSVGDVTVLPAESGYMVAQDFTQAKYMIQFRIEYITKPTE